MISEVNVPSFDERGVCSYTLPPPYLPTPTFSSTHTPKAEYFGQLCLSISSHEHADEAAHQ